MSDISGGKIAPHLALSDRKGRYPNQFFDLSQQYMPPTIKELFRWCTFYYYNSPLIGSALKKVSRYPITDLILEHSAERVRSSWKKVLVDTLKLKDRLMEVNLDYHVYGNAFVSVHLPFTRFLICNNCRHTQPIRNWNWSFKAGKFHGKCKTCEKDGEVRVKDVSYKSLGDVRLIRWNPENINIKFNEYTGRHIYTYKVPRKIKSAIESGDKDILEDLPLIVIEAVKKQRTIRLTNIKHLKNPTLAEQDQGWGKPTIIHVLKDMFYFYTLRRAQEAIALEHILPLDLIFPLPNAQQDPYVHTDLGSWRNKIEGIIAKHRQDPNFKGVLPVPVGNTRVGGDGRALMLSPEMNYLTQTIVGGMGIPQEFLFGGLNFTGSSISLRTLENDFIQNRSQLLDLVVWIKDKIRIWMGMPDIQAVRFSDFRMADDVQRNQQLVGLNAQGKLSDQTLLTELNFNYEEENKKIIEETFFKNYLMDLQSKGSAKSQGEAQLINWNYQQKIQELAEKAQAEAQRRTERMFARRVPSNITQELPEGAVQQLQQAQQGGMDPWGNTSGLPDADPNQGMPPDGMQPEGYDPSQSEEDLSDADQMMGAEVEAKVQRWGQQLAQLDPNAARQILAKFKQEKPQVGAQIEKVYNQLMSQAMEEQGGLSGIEDQMKAQSEAQRKAETMNGVNMDPLPKQRASTRGDMI